MNALMEMGYVLQETRATELHGPYVERGSLYPFCTFDPAHASRTPGGTIENC